MFEIKLFIYIKMDLALNNLQWLIWLIKENLKRETESLLIAAQNNVIRTNNIKARIDKTQQNSTCRLCGYRDKTINHIISEYSKLAQKECKTRHDWVRKVIHWEIVQENEIGPYEQSICTTQNLSWRRILINSSGILRYKRIK